MKGATKEHWRLAADKDNLYNSIYVFHGSTASVHHPERGDVPWHVALLLGGHHRKHVFSFRRQPSLDSLNASLTTFLRKFEWSSVLRGTGMLSAGFRVPSVRPTPPCTAPKPPELDAWSYLVRQTVLTAARRTMLRRARGHTNAPLFIKKAVTWLAASGYIALPTDKDAGFCLTTKDDVVKLASDLLLSSKYRVVREHELPSYEPIRKEYVELCKSVAKAEDNSDLLSHLLRSIRGTDSTHLYRTFSLTVKSHKRPGKVTGRNLHCGGHQPFSGLSRWVSWHLRSQLSSKRHILRDSQDLIRKLAGHVFSGDIKLYKIDIKESFLCGSPELLAQWSTLSFHEKLRPVAFKVVLFLLRNQFVRVRGLTEAAWQVQEGSGMGLQHSGEVADSAFFHLAKRSLLAAAPVQRRFLIEAFFRFKDDMIVVARSPPDALLGSCGLSALLRTVRVHARCFKLVVEAISSTSLPVLDVTVTVVRHKDGTASLTFGPYDKPTSIARPLSYTSAHPASVHNGWPFAVLRRKADQCANADAFYQVRARFVRKFVACHAPLHLIQRLNNFPFRKAERTPQASSSALSSAWMPLPYHPAWRNAHFSFALRQLHESTLVRSLSEALAQDGIELPQVRVA